MNGVHVKAFFDIIDMLVSPENKELFEQFKKQLMMYDPVHFAEEYLTLDGKPFTLSSNGYKPFSDIYRYIGIRALEKNAKPVILVKGRQVGATTMASALEMYFMGSGLFGGNDGKPPIRIIHAFPQLELAAAYSKTKLNQMIIQSKMSEENKDSKTKPKSYMQKLLDQSSDTNDSLHFKQFLGGNHLWIESTGIDADRLMGRSCDVIFFDECFPAGQKITTNEGKYSIGKLYNNFIKNEHVPLVKSYNEKSDEFEYKKILNVWKKSPQKLIELNLSGRKIKCTENHEFLTENGWKEASRIECGELIKSSIDTKKYVRSLNEDQKQIIIGSFLGDGHLSKIDISKYRLKVIHGISQEAYCSWKASMFNAETTYIEKNGYSQKPAINFCTKSFGLNEELPKTKNTCPQWVLDKLDARGIAIWFMDDGSKNRLLKNNGGCATISTNSFDEDSQKRFVKKFKELGIECQYKKYKYYSLYFNKNAFYKLCELIRPFVHQKLLYKIDYQKEKYIWNKNYLNNSWLVLKNKKITNEIKTVYDIEIDDNHNFILAPNQNGKTLGGAIAHNCQKTTKEAMGNALKILATAKYGKESKGVQIYFGTPRRKDSAYYRMWETSSQQYYFLGCEGCKEHFPLYTPGSDDWETIWIHTKVVKCPKCGKEQDKLAAQERGKWVALRDENDPDCKMIGFHINQLYMPQFTREDIENEKPSKHLINTERVFMNEVLGEFFQGDSSPMTSDEIRDLCGDVERKFSPMILPSSGMAKEMTFLGIDYGARADLEQLANPDSVKQVGQSFSTAVVLLAKGPDLLSIEFCTKFKRNDPESKKGIIDQLMRQYNITLAIGDIGYSNDFSYNLHASYGDRYLVSRAHNKINDHVKFNPDAFPKEIIFERDFYIGELYDQMKKGMIRFPLGNYEKIAWLIEHCASMELKPSISRNGADPSIHYVKGGSPNDGFMALLNAYLAYKFLVSRGFTNNDPGTHSTKDANKPLVMAGYVRRKI